MTAKTRLLGVLWTAGAVSVLCNVLAAEPTVIGRGVAAWPPIALILVVEVLARSPLPTGGLRWVAGGGAGAVALTAGLASFHHMHEVALTAGESELVAWLFPLTVDGLAIVASVGLLGQETRPELPDRDHPSGDEFADVDQPTTHQTHVPFGDEAHRVGGFQIPMPEPALQMSRMNGAGFETDREQTERET
jgi:hypothetical protein